MGSRWGGVKVPAVSLILSIFCVMGAARQLHITRSLGNSDWCLNNAKKVLWISENTSAIITGKSSSSNRRRAKDCQFVFGLASRKENARLVLYFNFLFIHDCGVKLQINESQTGDFTTSKTNHEIYMSQCNTMSPKFLYARPKHYVLVRLTRADVYRENYNFHLNVSMAESLPSTGPALHVVVIVGFVLAVVVLTATCLLFKYMMRLSYRWREQRSEEAMTRAISLYNSQEHTADREPDLVYVEPGNRESQDDHHHSPRNHHTTGPEIAFVHSDGRIERFRTTDRVPSSHSVASVSRNSPRSNRVPRKNASSKFTRGGGSSMSPVMSKPSPKVSRESSSQLSQEPAAIPLLQANTAPTRRSTGDVSEIGLDGGCDMPPSYEEALDMPGPSQLDAALGEEEEDEGDSLFQLEAGADENSVLGCLRIDYVNIGTEPGGEREHVAQDPDGECARGGHDPTATSSLSEPDTSDSGQALVSLPSSRLKDS
ncbi:uncharacterized protein LOC101852367 isoform X2 [Aplysia californica]|nr:uncharacterized protein LOC101852367 isoform X2 [Aplysia californica]XP_012935310.1 uncharacterized protein LOC101852367 isoform X2 [Aplysia californica]